MAVAYDASSASHASGSSSISQASFQWSHDPVGTPRGVLVFIFGAVDSVPVDTAVTYDGVSLALVAGSTAQDTATELGYVRCWFLGSGVPTTDPATVIVTRTNNTTELWAVVITVTAATNVETTGIVLLQNNSTYTQQNVDDGSVSGTNSVRFAGGYYGNNVTLPAGANSTSLFGNILVSYSFGAVRETTAGIGSRPVGFAIGTSDDRAATHLAIREASGSTTPALADSGSSSEALVSAAAVSVSDSGSATDTYAVSVPIGLADAGSSTQALSLAVVLLLAETASSSDTLTPAATLSLTDSAASTDASTATATLSPAQAGSAAETFASTVTLSLTDAGTGTDSAGIALTEQISDTGSATEILAPAVSTAFLESGASTDTAHTTAAIPLGDSASGVESSSTGIAVSFLETASVTDSFHVIKASIPLLEGKTQVSLATGALPYSLRIDAAIISGTIAIIADTNTRVELLSDGPGTLALLVQVDILEPA